MDKTFYVVRVEHPKEGQTLFNVEETRGGLEMMAFDSTPAIIAFLWATDPADACAETWKRAKEHFAQSHNKPLGTTEDLLRSLRLLAPEGPQESSSIL